VCGVASGLAGACAIATKTPLESVGEIGRTMVVLPPGGSHIIVILY
jgi:hypothetical protein